MSKINLDDKRITEDLNNLPENGWDFKESSTNDLIHGLHNYPAVMIYPISRQIIDIVSKERKIDTLLDPFAGSGTVLVEGQISNIPNVIGNDLNPLAVLISKAKTTILSNEDVAEYKRQVEIISGHVADNLNNIYDFENYIKEKCAIEENEEWAQNAKQMFSDFFKNKDMPNELPDYKNLGFWFIPSVVVCLSIVKSDIKQIKNKNIMPLIDCSFSEFVRYVSNTRNSEFKLYRIKKEKVRDLHFDLVKELSNIFNKNISKMIEYIKALDGKSSEVKICTDNCMNLKSIQDKSVDLIITSPPYGDSRTTVAYGQFSRLSSMWVGLTDSNNIDNDLLGGKKTELNLEELDSKTLTETYNVIKAIDEKRANEVLYFYHDLDKCIKSIAEKTKDDGYQFWVVGNRTVKKTLIKTDAILIELASKYGLINLGNYYRRISNKVMPAKNSPTNKAGDLVATMENETIVFFKKVKGEN